MNAQTFYVAGMSCDHCVRAVTEEVSKLPGVERVDVDLATGAARIADTVSRVRKSPNSSAS